MTPRLLLVATALAAAALSAQAAGLVEVSFTKPREFADAGRGALDTERTTKTLAEHLQRLGKALPDGQTLRIEVLDIDLAGTLVPGRGADVRVLRGGADWPSMQLRYTLTADGKTLKSGEDKLSDMNYFMSPPRGASSGDLPYEERMLTRWFDERFGTAQAQ